MLTVALSGVNGDVVQAVVLQDAHLRRLTPIQERT